MKGILISLLMKKKTYRVMSNIKDLREYFFSSEDEDSILEYYNEKKTTNVKK